MNAALDMVDLMRRALDGDAQAMERLIAELTPVIFQRVSAILAGSERRGRKTDRREDARDLVNETFLALFEDDAKVLRRWAPERGASLKGFVGLVADRTAISILRNGRRSAWREDPTSGDELEVYAGATRSHESAILDRAQLQRILDRLREELPPRGLRLFFALYVEMRAPAEVAREEGMTMNALNTWKNRLRGLVRQIEPIS